MPATVVAERIGRTRRITVLRERGGRAPTYLVAESVGRTEYNAGELAQWDLWFPDCAIPVGHGQSAVLPVLAGWRATPAGRLTQARAHNAGPACRFTSGRWDPKSQQ